MREGTETREKMRILYVNHYAGSPRHGMEYRPHYMARHWVRMGHEVTIVAASVSHVRYKAPEMTADITEEMIDGVRYLWLKTPPYEGNGVRRAVNMAAFVLGLFRMRRVLAGRFAPDAVIASSTYTWDIFPVHAIARASGARLVFEVHDLWPLSPMELGGMSKWHPFILSLQWGENHACRHADAVISMLPLADRHLCTRGMARDKFHYVPNGIELAEWQAQSAELPQTHLELIERCRRQGHFVMCYAGSHGLSDALDVLIDAARLLQDQPVDFVLVGQGPQKARLQRLAADARLRKVHFLDPVPKEAIPSLLRSADGLYIGSKRQPLYRFGISPNKLMDYMAAGKPIINSNDAGNDPVGEAGCGFTIGAEDHEALAQAVKRLMRLSVEDRERMGEAGKAYVSANHDYAFLAQKFLSAI